MHFKYTFLYTILLLYYLLSSWCVTAARLQRFAPLTQPFLCFVSVKRDRRRITYRIFIYNSNNILCVIFKMYVRKKKYLYNTNVNNIMSSCVFILMLEHPNIKKYIYIYIYSWSVTWRSRLCALARLQLTIYT